MVYNDKGSYLKEAIFMGKLFSLLLLLVGVIAVAGGLLRHIMMREKKTASFREEFFVE